jgi:hypothetical protein
MRETIYELWALHELFQRMGIKPAEIFMVPRALSPDGKPTCGVTIVRNGECFTVTLLPPPGLIYDPEALAREWTAFVTGPLQHMTNADLWPVWEASFARNHTAEIMLAMVVKAPNLGRTVVDVVERMATATHLS